MKILNASQIRKLDEYTITHEPISSINLMERASSAFVNNFIEKFNIDIEVFIFCGTGNNGGDGLAIARLLDQKLYRINVYIIGESAHGTLDFKTNMERLKNQITPNQVKNIAALKFPQKEKFIIIDAIFGSGLNRDIDGLAAEVIEKINKYPIVSVDIPSGLYADKTTINKNIVKAQHTISFQLPKLAFLQPENQDYVGNWELVDIGLSQEFINKEVCNYYYTENKEIKPQLRRPFSHKGTFGHAFLVAGSYGMMGAAILASKACLRSGIGKITIHTPKLGIEIMQIAVPEAIIDESLSEKNFSGNWNLEKFDAIGIGPGIGLENRDGFISLLSASKNKKIVLDADAITMLGNQPELLKLITEKAILTPHPKEFKTLIGKNWKNDFEKLEILSEFCVKHKVIVCLKGKNTAVALSDGSIHFNSTGNTGMATAGSGDVLTGIILGFLAQGYSPEQAAIQGVFEHGLAGERASKIRSERAVIASDIVENIK